MSRWNRGVRILNAFVLGVVFLCLIGLAGWIEGLS
jgi:hypothetical protein